MFYRTEQQQRENGRTSLENVRTQLRTGQISADVYSRLLARLRNKEQTR